MFFTLFPLFLFFSPIFSSPMRFLYFKASIGVKSPLKLLIKKRKKKVSFKICLSFTLELLLDVYIHDESLVIGFLLNILISKKWEDHYTNIKRSLFKYQKITNLIILVTIKINKRLTIVVWSYYDKERKEKNSKSLQLQ